MEKSKQHDSICINERICDSCEEKENSIGPMALASGNQITISNELAKALGIEDSTPLTVVMDSNKIEFHANIHSLAKVYIEPTSECNLKCQTCIRETWSESLGSMSLKIFDELIEQLKAFKNLQSVMFGGFGEPTFHKDILYMIGRVKSLGLKAEMVTNGTLLNENMLLEMSAKGLDTLWVSFDGTSTDSFDDIRAGASFNHVVKNLQNLAEIQKSSSHKIKVGITFVVMKKNIEELKKLRDLAKLIKAEMISISNVIPYSANMVDQMLCNLSIRDSYQTHYPRAIPISLPYIDLTELTKRPLYNMFQDFNNINNSIQPATETCRFIKERCTFIKWDGTVSTCMGLLHSHKTYLTKGKIERNVKAYSLGNILNDNLKTIWDSQEYHDFREKVQQFEFSPCLDCGTCKYSETNEEDCFGNQFPTCGGCLWSLGLIRCP